MQYKKIMTGVALAASIGIAQPTSAAEVVMSAVGPTTQDYAMAVVWSNLLAKSGSKNKMTVVDNGSVKGLRKLAQGQVDIVAIGAPHYRDATQRGGKFKKDPEEFIPKYKDMSALFAIRTSAAQYIARTDSGVTNIPEFKGKTLAIGRPGGNAGRVTTALFKAHGIDLTAGDADGQYLKYGPALEQMANGNMDATLVWGGLPHAAVENASRQMKLRFVSPDPKMLMDFRSNITNGDFYVFQRVPKETIKSAYGGRVESARDAYFWTFPFMMVVRNDMPADVAYDITKTIWDNIADVNKTSAALSLITIDGATDSLSADLHPGAMKYFKEVGVIK